MSEWWKEMSEWWEEFIGNVSSAGYGFTVEEDDMELWEEEIDPQLTYEVTGSLMASRDVMWVTTVNGLGVVLVRYYRR